METSLPYRVYRNLESLLFWRRLELVSANATSLNSLKGTAFLEEDVFLPLIQYHGYIAISARDAKDKVRSFRKNFRGGEKFPTATLIVLLDANDQFIENSEHFNKLMAQLPLETSDNLDVLLISNEKPKVNVTNNLKKYYRLPTEEKGYIRFTIYGYHHFSTRRMESKYVCPSVVLSREEREQKLNSSMQEKAHCPGMMGDDMVAIWLGAEPGDVVYTQCPSESSGITPIYYLVKANPLCYP